MNHHDKDTSMEERLVYLERTLARWRRSAFAALIFMPLIFIFGGSPQPKVSEKDELEAKRVVVRDTNGTPRLVLGITDGDPNKCVPFVTLRDKDGAACVSMLGGSAKGGGSSLVFFGADAKTRISLHMTDDGSGAITLVDKNGEERFEVFVEPDGPTIMAIKDIKGEVRVAATASADRSAKLSVFDADGKEIFNSNKPK